MTQHQALWHAQRPAWIRVASLSDPYGRDAAAWQQAGLLDHGEAEAVALARQMSAQWFLTDDAAARLFAQSLGVEVHGSLGVVLWGGSCATS
jgi:predicted nucleic acid-binding protein